MAFCSGSQNRPSPKPKPPHLFLLLLLLVPVLFFLEAATVSWPSFSHSSLLLVHHPISKLPTPISPTLSYADQQQQQQQQQQSPNSSIWNPISTSNSNLEAEAAESGPYHNWDLFSLDFEDMLRNLKIFVYPDAFNTSSPFSNVFLPHPNPLQPRLSNYYSEHVFKTSLLSSPFLSPLPQRAHFFFMPFSVNALRNDPRVRSEPSIARFVAEYTRKISQEFGFWNASGGSDHFYVYCHSVGRDAAWSHRQLFNNAIQVTCSSSYFQRLYVAHKDVGLPQVWPRPPEKALTPPHARKRLAFFAGRAKNSQVRQQLVATWANDTSMDIFSGNLPFPYEEGFRRSRYCLHVKGYEVNTARISDAMHYGCIPVIISNHYDLPFANVLDWSKFSIIVNHGDIALLKQILLSMPTQMYLDMYQNLCQVRKHFQWHRIPRGYDAFHMTLYQLWVRRGICLFL